MDSEVVKLVRNVRDEIVANYYRMKLVQAHTQITNHIPNNPFIRLFIHE